MIKQDANGYYFIANGEKYYLVGNALLAIAG
jgi:hypothetical protein